MKRVRRLASPSLVVLGLVAVLAAGCDANLNSVTDWKPEGKFIRFTDDHTWYEMRGEMEVTFYENYVRVRRQEKGDEYIIPRERVTYVGPEIR